MKYKSAMFSSISYSFIIEKIRRRGVSVYAASYNVIMTIPERFIFPFAAYKRKNLSRSRLASKPWRWKKGGRQ